MRDAAKTTSPEAPWYYRKRFAMFELVFGASFFFGYLIAGLTDTLAPVFVTSGRPALFGALAAVLAVGGWLVRVWASSYLTGSVVWRQGLTGGELRVSGPYRFTRNPLYLGNVLQALGIGLVFPWPVLALLPTSMLTYCLALIEVEERFLAREHDWRYAEYRARVPRLFPLPGRAAPDGGQHGALREGLRSEELTAFIAVGAVVLLIVVWPR